MADIITYPENGITYDADDAAGYLATRLSGVYSAEEDFAVTAVEGLSVQVSAGQAWVRPARFKGRSIIMEQPTTVVLTEADPVRSRIDRLVLRYDAAAKKTTLVVLDGTPDSAGPVAPDISRTALVYDLCLAEIRRPAGSTAVTAADIFDTRADETVCGVMRDGVQGIPAATLIQKLRAEIDKVVKGSFYDKTETDALLDALQEQVKSAAGAAAKPVPVWTGEVVPNGSGGGVTQTLQLPSSVDYLELKTTTSDHGAVYRLLPGNTVYPFNQYCPFVLRTDKVLSYRGHNADASRTYLTGYHYETFSDGVKIPQVVGFRDASNSYNNSTFTVDDSVDYIAAQWVSASTADSVTVRDSSSLIRLRGSYSYLFNFATDGTITLYGSKNVGAYTIKFTFYHYATPEELAAQQTATQSAQADTDAMTVDQEYRIALLELGITDETT